MAISTVYMSFFIVPFFVLAGGPLGLVADGQQSCVS